MRTIARAFAAALLACALPAGAHFHLWRMTEIYSSADGTVQFLELHSPADGENLATGNTLVVTGDGAMRTYTFPSDLFGRTRNKYMLVATEGFAALGGIQPDYVVPNGFLPARGGLVNFANFDAWQVGALPADGQSLNRLGNAGPPTPRNFADQVGSVAPAPNYQALWWGAPAGSESGWGLNLTHQGDVLFATWFTYDSDGTAMWLVAPGARRTTGNAFAGALYRTTGPAFDSAQFDAARVAPTEVGSATFTFTDANAGTFAYTVNGVSQSKAITRQLFGPATTCTSGGAAGATPNYQDLWWRSSESGWGVNIAHQGEVIFATWFTYEASGKGMWIVMPEGRRDAAGAWSGKLYRTTGAPFDASPWDPARVRVTEVGSGSFSFASAEEGTFAYTVNGVSQSKAIARQVFATPKTVCR
jgi:hypothetical protein